VFPKVVRREILILLAAKAVALTAIYFIFFAPTDRSTPSAREIETHLLGSIADQGDLHGHR
jgi:hypothetical protein